MNKLVLPFLVATVVGVAVAQFGPSSGFFGPPDRFRSRPPQSSFGFGGPSQSFGGPSQSFGGQSQRFGPPQSFGGPSQSFGGFGGTSQGFSGPSPSSFRSSGRPSFGGSDNFVGSSGGGRRSLLEQRVQLWHSESPVLSGAGKDDISKSWIKAEVNR